MDEFVTRTPANSPGDDPADLLGAYALDAVDPAEAIIIEEYLRHRPEAALELREHREVAAWLGYSTAAAPAGLWERITDRLETDFLDPDRMDQQSGHGDKMPEFSPRLVPVPPVASSEARARRVAVVPRWVLAAAAAVVLVLAAAVVWPGSSPVDPLQLAVEQLREDRDVRRAVLSSETSDAQVEVWIDLRGHGFLEADALPRLSRTETYQLWGVLADKVISLGVLGPSPSVETFTARGDLRALAITVEPAGGVISDGNPAGAYSGEVD